ncbi:Swc4p KNAG_0D03400 [Huiozyma naganishii CBS 8797]|uniref:SWR1-complex protein 4 n=1 Tax=Huiozyma naganishii (strain ATCC MYA-139 / BCRC 22969 / CBS 8797 / KCTC 17520 / NBRC 10181 / NCYC 3082 / Yp74L-3) TaxID=1071383 RepID=J7RY81_HUIN7|nr:hypothetical protein KNAG_0D03400 [Kazachstania naganishii CBS 8797]CCK70087.1 hypothetical protein KNAG_0D03400 [Kazachstania naganishii CBS 8797]
MSSNDVFDVLNINKKSSTPVPAPSAGNLAGVAGSTNKPKPQVTGMQRELYSLLGENQPPVMVAQTSSRFKEKLAGKPSPWSKTDFFNARKDNPYKLTFQHWMKGSKELLGDEPQESTFLKFDQHFTLPTFTKEEYDEFMKPQNDSSSNTEENENRWSFEEVDYLMQLCKKYDLRWFVIEDRYNFGESVRSLEDLKEQFYEVCRRYFENKGPAMPLLKSLTFDKSKETDRKAYLQRLLSRSAAEIAEEEALIIESRKFEMAAKKTLNDRESLLRLLDSPNSNKSVVQYMTSQGMSLLYSNMLNDKSKKRKHEAGVPENPWMKQQQQFAQQKQQLQQLHEKKLTAEQGTDSGSEQSPRKTKRQKQELQNAIKRKSEAQYAEYLLQSFTMEERKNLGVIAHGEKLSPGVFLRSTKISTFKPALQNKVSSTMQELGLPLRPAMPSYDVVQKEEELLKAIVSLLELKKQLDKLEAEKAIRS